MVKRKNRGQTSLEYSMVIVIILGVLVAMGVYFKRGLQGKWKETIDQIGDQYDPMASNAAILQTDVSTTISLLQAQENAATLEHWTSREDQTNSTQTTSGSRTIGSYW